MKKIQPKMKVGESESEAEEVSEEMSDSDEESERHNEKQNLCKQRKAKFVATKKRTKYKPRK